jgi:hypothetical protein
VADRREIQRFLEQGRLVPEVEVHRLDRDRRPVRHPVQGRSTVTALKEQISGRTNDPQPREPGTLSPSQRPC